MGVHVLSSLVPLTIIVVLCCVLFIAFALVVHYAVYMYIHTVHRAVLEQGFVCLFSSVVPHCHQLSIVGDKDS